MRCPLIDHIENKARILRAFSLLMSQLYFVWCDYTITVRGLMITCLKHPPISAPVLRFGLICSLNMSCGRRLRSLVQLSNHCTDSLFWHKKTGI